MTRVAPECPPGWIDPRVSVMPHVPPPAKGASRPLDGVVVPVWAGDVYMAKACCASIRRFMGDIPITLLVDGPADTRQLERLAGVSRLEVRQFGPEYVRLCSGTSWVKLALFWACPYERFLCLDADTLVWGDVRVYAEFDKYDFIGAHHVGGGFRIQTPQDATQYAFDLAIMRRFDPTLHWRGRQVAIAGVFFARRGVFSEERLMQLRRLDCWRCWEQGLVNYLMWRSQQDGDPRVGAHPIQVSPSESSFSSEGRFLPADWERPVVIHWLGRKPKLGRRYVIQEEHRRLFLQLAGRSSWSGLPLLWEDISVFLARHRRSLSKKLKGPKRTTIT